MEYSPPPLFKQGAPARVKVAVFAFLSIALLVIDSRYHALSTVRQVRLNQPQGLVVRDPSGRTNWDSSTSGPAARMQQRGHWSLRRVGVSACSIWTEEAALRRHFCSERR